MIRTTRNLTPLLAACAAVGLFAAAPAVHAGPASIVKENADGELNRVDSFEQLYGGSFSTSDHETFSNGQITLTPTSHDAIWSAGTYDVAAVARFAASSQSFGTFGAGGFTSLFDVQGYGFDITGSATTTQSTPFAFWRDGDSTSRHFSVPFANADKRDHLLTYEVAGLTDTTARTWVLFWEDLDLFCGQEPDGRSSSDYNDLVLQVKEAPARVRPGPGGAGGGAAARGGVAGTGGAGGGRDLRPPPPGGGVSDGQV